MSGEKITEIKNFLNSWKDGVIEIGRIYLDKGDYVKQADKFLSHHYAFDTEKVLFKPTFTKEVIFRNKKIWPCLILSEVKLMKTKALL